MKMFGFKTSFCAIIKSLSSYIIFLLFSENKSLPSNSFCPKIFEKTGL